MVQIRHIDDELAITHCREVDNLKFRDLLQPLRSSVPKSLENRSSWAEYARCHGCDPALYYSESIPLDGKTKLALKVCNTCPVKTECLVYAIGADEYLGVWGELTPYQRYTLRRWLATEKFLNEPLYDVIERVKAEYPDNLSSGMRTHPRCSIKDAQRREVALS
jgi:WhiB family transcriptional regulator, redox-sensing transcriptional regulator